MKVTVEPTQDFALLNQIVRHPEVFAGSSDDGSDPSQVDLEKVSGTAFLLARADLAVAGFYALHFHNQVMAEIHTCILPHCRGAIADEAIQKAIEWTFTHTPCMKLITFVPAFNRPALQYALRAGARKEGLVTASFMKNGVLHDQHLLTLSREN